MQPLTPEQKERIARRFNVSEEYVEVVENIIDSQRDNHERRQENTPGGIAPRPH